MVSPVMKPLQDRVLVFSRHSLVTNPGCGLCGVKGKSRVSTSYFPVIFGSTLSLQRRLCSILFVLREKVVREIPFYIGFK